MHFYNHLYSRIFHLKVGLEFETFCTVDSPKQFLPSLTISTQIWTNYETHTHIFKKWGGTYPRLSSPVATYAHGLETQ